MDIDLEVDGDRVAAHRLREIGNRASDVRPAWDEVYRALLIDHEERFATRGFGLWDKAADSTRARKAREGKDPRVMHVLGTLERAVSGWKAPGQVYRPRRAGMAFGFSGQGVAFHGKFAQTGEGEPKREVVGWTARTTRRVHQALRDHLLGRF